ncbi:hypothetical protein [Variovorax terrae]|uniref:Uncharacterized protein n=1 Tax=Variovorax terrae TaxID=2923278 RepID=A0A9X1VXZ4_9BURK|nr:hypothetical protein [Variovorax terrae]MCJ0765328.1 hypothetical protein [Variovorax terrae]
MRGYIVQDAESGGFLAPDGEGGVVLVRMLVRAVPFACEESASDASADHLDGCGVVIPVWVPES